MLAPGFKVIHQADFDTNSTCLTFVICLRLVKQWSDAHPGHVPMDIHVEMKDATENETSFRELEREMLAAAAREEFEAAASLRDRLDELRLEAGKERSHAPRSDRRTSGPDRVDRGHRRRGRHN
jgi:hypothetical protein